MANPIVVRISHALGKAEATRRIEAGFGTANSMLPAVVKMEKSGGGDLPLSLVVNALGQRVTAIVTVEEDHVLVEATVPAFLAPIARRLLSQSVTTKLLSGPSSK
jgi:hypothetical protein